jgi:hypothetical protein
MVGALPSAVNFCMNLGEGGMRGLGWLGAAAGGLSGALLVAITAHAADMPAKAPVMMDCTRAVDGLNGKVSADGGTFNDKTLYGGQGSLSVPLGCQ